MNFKITIGLVAFLLMSCKENDQKDLSKMAIGNPNTVETLIGSKPISDEIAGSKFRKRAIGYFVITGTDTSDYTCIFTESKADGKIGINLNIPYLKAKMSYRQRLKEIKLILPKASNDFNFDSLTSIGFGRLILSGDLAIDISKQYNQEFGTTNVKMDYKAVGEFLTTSKLGSDLNEIFKSYSVSVDDVSIEKLHFTTKEELYWASKIETDSTKIPEKILDCITWVKVSKK